MKNNDFPQDRAAAAVEYITYANMVDILEQERKRIAYDIHDNVQHALRLLRDTAPVNLKQDIDNVIDSLREVCYRLTPKSLDEFSLVDYLPIYIVTLQRSCKFYIDYRGNATSKLPSKVEADLFGIINEAINNIMKYAAQTPVVFVRFWEDEEKYVLSIQDLGKGFDVSQTTNTIGLQSMRGRAEMLNATFDLQSTIGEGTKIKIFLPKANVSSVDTIQTPNTIEQPENIDPLLMCNDVSDLVQIDNNLIYIIDNQEEIGLGLKQIIENEFSNYQIVVFTDPDDATKALRVLNERNEAQPAIIISDITMPNKSGFVFVTEAQKISPSSKYIIYTVNDLPIYVVKAVKELKVSAFVCKEEEGSGAHFVISAISQIDNQLLYCSPKVEQIRHKINTASEKYSWKQTSISKYAFLLINEIINIEYEDFEKKLSDYKTIENKYNTDIKDYNKKLKAYNNKKRESKPEAPNPIVTKSFKDLLMDRFRKVMTDPEGQVTNEKYKQLRKKIIECQNTNNEIRKTELRGTFKPHNYDFYMKIINEIYQDNLWSDKEEAKWYILRKIADDIFSANIPDTSK